MSTSLVRVWAWAKHGSADSALVGLKIETFSKQKQKKKRQSTHNERDADGDRNRLQSTLCYCLDK